MDKLLVLRNDVKFEVFLMTNKILLLYQPDFSFNDCHNRNKYFGFQLLEVIIKFVLHFKTPKKI